MLLLIYFWLAQVRRLEDDKIRTKNILTRRYNISRYELSVFCPNLINLYFQMKYFTMS